MKKLFMMGCAIAILAGCTSKEQPGLNEERVSQTRELIQTTISDADREKEMLAVIDAFERDMTAIEKEIRELRLEIVKDNADYSVTESELRIKYDQLGGLAEKMGNTLRDRSLELRGLCSEEEWSKIAHSNDAVVDFTF